MFWHVLSVLLCPLYVLASRLLGADGDRLILRRQALILQRHLGKRPTPTQAERLALVLACAGMAKTRLPEDLHAIMLPSEKAAPKGAADWSQMIGRSEPRSKPRGPWRNLSNRHTP